MKHLLGLLLILPLLLLAACSNSEPANSVSENGSSDDSSPTSQTIPVEALPDPLPEPYLFRDEVTIESETITETIYVVQPGDTLAFIADRFCITLVEIQRLNTIVDVSQLSIGEELRIPIREGGCGGASPDTASAEPQLDPDEPKPGEIYIVEAGDSLAEIAALFGYTWRDLMTYNGLSESQAVNLQIGQELIIPPPPADVGQQSQQSEIEEPPG